MLHACGFSDCLGLCFHTFAQYRGCLMVDVQCDKAFWGGIEDPDLSQSCLAACRQAIQVHLPTSIALQSSCTLDKPDGELQALRISNEWGAK